MTVKKNNSRKQPKVRRNYIALVIDESGSMYHLQQKVQTIVNSILDNLGKPVAGQENYIILTRFASTVKVGDFAKNVSLVDYYPSGSTALFDAIAQTIRKMDALNIGNDDAFLVNVITDGEENCSTEFNVHKDGGKRLNSMMIDRCRKGNWTFTIQLPPGASKRFCDNFNISSDNVREWENTYRGLEDAGNAMVKGLTSYFSARSAGHKTVDNFYVDMSKVKPTDVKRELVDLSAKFKKYEVNAEQDIRTFVESKTKKPYVVGSTYYELTKPEKVQPAKSVLITEKNKNAVWGGDEARDLIGIPANETVKVTPLDHGKYRIFVNSTSTNRKLVRGTTVLVDVTKTQHSKPTWEDLQHPDFMKKSR